MRPSKPWYRSDRDAWYVQHNGKQVLLTRGKANRAKAVAEFHKLMFLGTSSAPDVPSLQVATLCDLFLDYSKVNHTADSYRNYRFFLQDFCTVHGMATALDIKPFHVTRWLDSKSNWNGAKRHAIITVKRAFSWSEQQGLIASNPLRSITVPRGRRRERVLTLDERNLILESVRDECFQKFLLAMMGTGCRPSEVASVTAKQVNLELGVWVLPQHKTAKKTGKPRIVYLSPVMLELTRSQMTRNPVGPLFPNLRGRQFDRNAWRCRFRRLREKHPSLSGVVCYSLRHSFATDALVNGVGIAQVAELMGHTSTEMVSRVYGHIASNVDHMRRAAANASPDLPLDAK